MKKISLLLIAFTSIALTSLTAPTAKASESSAGFTFNPAAMYLIDNRIVSGTQSGSTSRLLADISLGYTFNSPLYIGAMYSIDNKSINYGGSVNTINVSSYGPSVGLNTENLYLIFTYYISSQDVESPAVGASTTYNNGNGYNVALGYRFNISNKFGLAPELAYRSTSYTSTTTGASANLTLTTLLPYIGFWFSF